MQTRNALLLTASMAAALAPATAQAGSLETQNNPVANGGIVIIPTDPDRSDWAGVTTYQADVDGVTPVLSYGGISIAHDDDNFYFRLLMDSYDELDPQQSYFGAHHQILIDIDNNRNTGWIGGDGDLGTDDDFFAIGADVMIEGPAVWKYGTFANPGGANQELWTWGNLIAWGGVNFDDSPPSDIELQVPRSTIFYNNPAGTKFDFIPVTTDGAFVTQDVYPTTGIFDPLTQSSGDYFTYDINYVAPNLEGDLNSDGFVGIADLNIVLGAWNQTVFPGDPLAGDPTGDGFVGIADLNVVLGNWNAGTPPSAPGSAVPEPATLALLGLGGMALLKRRA
jgi:hypothetical protein